MPKKKKTKVTGIYVVVSAFVLLLSVSFSLFISIGILIGSLINAFLVYWMLGVGGKAYLKRKK